MLIRLDTLNSETPPPWTSSSPIGVFDSGVGGLSVLRPIRALLPHENLIYIADSGFAPYGEKSQDWIRNRSIQLTEQLVSNGAKAIVVACNTATAAAVKSLRAQYSLPIIGMEPAVKPAIGATRTQVVGVLATVGTLKSAYFAALLARYQGKVQFLPQACPGWVECVENGELDTPQTRKLIASHVLPLLAQGADTLVLGCTHFPFLRSVIQEMVGPGVTLIDTGLAVARQVERQLQVQGRLNPSSEPGMVRFFSSGNLALAKRVLSLKEVWPEPIDIQSL